MGHSSASEAAERAVALAQAGAVVDAYRLLEQAVAAGDGLAAATLADWRMAGQIVRRDLVAAQTLYGRALELGIEAAAGPHFALRASGAGGGGGGGANDRPGSANSNGAIYDVRGRQFFLGVRAGF